MQSNMYSQAFNFGSFIKDGVDPRTGQFTASVTLYEAPAAVRNSPPLKLCLAYSPLNTQDTGFGIGWSLNLSTFHRGPETLSLSTGEHYKVDQSGGSVVVKDQKLKGFHLKKQDRDFHVIHKSGLVEILSNVGNAYNISVPIEILTENGRSLKLAWTSFGDQPRLQTIQEDSQVLLQIVYDGDETRVTRAPNTATSSILTAKRRDNLLLEFSLPVEDMAWKFSYDTLDHMPWLVKVTNPAGLVEEVRYEVGHGLPNGAPRHAIPYVVLHTMDPKNEQPLIKTHYKYSDKNFFGYKGVDGWKDGEDNLFRVWENYQYWSTARVEGGPETTRTYDKFHLMTSSTQTQGSKEVTQKTAYFASVDRPFGEQPAQYQLPRTVETTYRDASNPHATRTEMASHDFDEYGNPIEETATNGIRTARVYFAKEGEVDPTTSEVLCPADPHGFTRYLKTEIITPAQGAGTSRMKCYKYGRLSTPPGLPMDGIIVACQLETMEDHRSLSASQYTYFDQPAARDHGRLQKLVTRLSGHYPVTKSWKYQYLEPDQLTTTARTQTFDNHIVKDEKTHSLCSGLILSNRDDDGVEVQFEYDAIGRQTKETVCPGTPFEATRQYEYGLAKSGVGYHLTVTDAKGIQKRHTTDGLERVLLVEEQDDAPHHSASTSGAALRVIEERCYNKLGQCIQVNDVDWLTIDGERREQSSKKTLEYDDWGQVWKVKDSSGMVTLSVMNPLDLTHIEGIEGEGTTKTYLNLFGTPTRTERLKRDGTSYSNVDYAYDGFGRLSKETDNGRITQYQFDCFDRVVQTALPDGRVVKTDYAAQSISDLPQLIKVNDHSMGKQSFDGLDRNTAQTIGTRTTTKSYKGNEPRPIQITTAKGDKHDLTYEPALNHALTSLKSTDGADTYQHDSQSAATIKLDGSYSTETRRLLPSGLLVGESFELGQKKKFSAQSSYSMAGKLQSYIDVHGQAHEIQYDNHGRPEKLSQGKVKITFAYDKASRISESWSCDEESNQSLTTRLGYDEFGREVERTILQGTDTLYTLSQTFSATSLVSRRQMLNGKGDTLRNETFQYDSCDRLVDYQCQGIQPPVDENHQALRKQHFTFDQFDNIFEVSTTFQDGSLNTTRHIYSKTDPTQVIQITNSHPKYSPTIDLQYDQNGCLTQDEQGRKLKYDSRNRLTGVCDANGQTLSQYHYDAAGKLVCQEVQGKPTYLHYRGDTLIATTGESNISYISDGNTYWGQILQNHEKGEAQLWASDTHESVLAWVDTQKPDAVHYQGYTPYGFSVGATSIAFNGQWRDTVTGWYHLGNGYRVYNPVLKRFHNPDSWSPFISGEINPYAYCLCDPINRIDPSGHASLSGRDWAMMGVGMVVGLIVGVLTGGAGFAIAAGLGIAAAVTTDVVTGAVWDAAHGNTPTLGSVGTDALYGLIGGVAGEVGGIVLSKGIKFAAQGIRKSSNSIATVLAEQQSSFGPVRHRPLRAFRGKPYHIRQPGPQADWLPTYTRNLGGQQERWAFVTHGRDDGWLMGPDQIYIPADEFARTYIRPKMGENRDPIMLIACHATESGAAQQVADALGQGVTSYSGVLRPMSPMRFFGVQHYLSQPGGSVNVFGFELYAPRQSYHRPSPNVQFNPISF